jgi:2,4-dienoyl-CoA reductase-like NADH-dependent reductase (Old Yellow Enzyme family)/thioredoxin reductase
MKGLEHLLQPIKVKNLTIPNRVVLPPMGTVLTNPDGSVGERLLAFFERRVKSGAGFVINEITSVHPMGSSFPGELAAFDDRYIPGLRKLVEVAHRHGSKIAAQLHHVGRESSILLDSGEAMGPSAIPSYVYDRAPREMTLDDIAEVIDSFGKAAARLREAGYDAVEIHGAHGYLLCQFLSANSNKRTDEYGGDLRQRARFVIEVLQSVRRAVGDDFPISLRLSVEEMIKGGYTVDEMVPIIPEFVKAGADIIHASFGTHGTPGGLTSAPIEYLPGFAMPLARRVKEVVDVPVIGVGRFTDPFVANEYIARGDADMIAFGRQHLADPDFLKNAINGKPHETIECLACNQGCIEREMLEGRRIRCAINPETGMELRYPTKPAEKSRVVWVIGGGPAGLTAAYESARLGHNVTLFEMDSKTGGQVNLAAKAPFKEAYGRWIEKLTAKAERAGVNFQMNTRVTSEMIADGNPEVVILATGAEEAVPPIAGIDLPHVCFARQVLNGEVPCRGKVLVVGGGLVGMEVADYCREQGCTDLVLTEEMPESPVSKAASHGYMLHKRFRQAGYQLILGARVKEITSKGVLISVGGDEQWLTGIDQVIIATGTKPRNELRDFLQEKGITHHIVGDAVQGRRIIEAVEEGARAAWSI